MTQDASHPANLTVTVRYFASMRETLGRDRECLNTQAGTLRELRDDLIARGGVYAECMARGRAVRAALNQILCDESAPLTQGCEVAFFPPVTGG